MSPQSVADLPRAQDATAAAPGAAAPEPPLSQAATPRKQRRNAAARARGVTKATNPKPRLLHAAAAPSARAALRQPQ